MIQIKTTHEIEDSISRASRVLVIYTGGTCGMVQRDDGSLEASSSYLSKTLVELSAAQTNGFPAIEVHECVPVMDSSDMGPSDWVSLANDIGSNYDRFDGFVIIMGTDTMAYAASAMSFMLVNLSKPVVFTGSMIPLFKVYTDARRNMLIAIDIAGNSKICEVTLFFQNKLMRGNRAKKVTTAFLTFAWIEGSSALKGHAFQSSSTTFASQYWKVQHVRTGLSTVQT